MLFFKLKILKIVGGGFIYIYYFHPFQMGWNHQLEKRRNIRRRENPQPRSCLVVLGPIFVEGWGLAPGKAEKQVVVLVMRMMKAWKSRFFLSFS